MEMQTIMIPLGRAGKYGQLTVECARFSPHVQQHVWEYGLRQILNDAIADKSELAEGRTEQDLADCLREKATKRLQTLYSGELRARGTAEPADPVEAEAQRLVWAKIVEKTKTFPEYADTKGEKDRVMATLTLRAERKGKVAPDRAELIAAQLQANPKFLERAKRIVAERTKDDIDANDL